MIYSMISLYTFIFGWPNKSQSVGRSMYLVGNKSVVFIDFCEEIEESVFFKGLTADKVMTLKHMKNTHRHKRVCIFCTYLLLSRKTRTI
jgi:hypothetical protein